jgi:Na+-driven multidrug efflux pump
MVWPLLVASVALIAKSAFAARFGVEALVGYGLAARLELLIYRCWPVATTKVGTCLGAGLVERARHVTFVSCVLVVAIFGTAGLGVAVSGSSIVEQFTHVEEVVLAAIGYFRVTGSTPSWLCR